MNARQAAATSRAAGVASPADRPSQRRHSEEAGSSAGIRRSAPVIRAKGSATEARIGGVASTTEDPYEMYDFYGQYTEIVSAGAFAKTLGANPLVEFTINHGAGGGIPMAHTRNGTLTLSETDEGLDYEAVVDPQRSDVADMLRAMERGDLAEASFKFRITRGMWSPDYTEYRIEEVDLERGDVSAVNFGANPNATSGLRNQATGGYISHTGNKNGGSITVNVNTSQVETAIREAMARVLPKAVVISDEDCQPRRARL